MKMSTVFPSKFLRAGDLEGDTKYSIRDITIEEVGDGHKPVLYFNEVDKGLVLNKTNNDFLMMLYGDESDDWTDQEIVLYPTEADFQGKRVAAIRLKVPKKKPPSPLPARPRVPSGPSSKGNSNPSVPDDDLEDAPF